MQTTIFSLVAGGSASVRRVRFTLISGKSVQCGVRVLLDAEDDAIETAARKAAIDRGVAEPKPGEPIYDRWIRLFTLLYGCVAIPDDAPDQLQLPDAPLFFDGGVDQIQHNLDRERIAYLFAMQEQWQGLIAPRPRGLDRDQFIAAVFKHATSTVGADELPFWFWHPALQESFLVTTCALLMSSPAIKSLYGSRSEASSSNSGSEAGVNLDPAEAARTIDAAMLVGDARAAALGGAVHEVELPEHAAARVGGHGGAPLGVAHPGAVPAAPIPTARARRPRAVPKKQARSQRRSKGR